MAENNQYTIFDGCDIVVSFDENFYGDLQGFEYDINRDKKGIVKIDRAVFGDTFHEIPEGAKMQCFYANEFGKFAYLEMKLGKKVSEKYSISIDGAPKATEVFECELTEPFHAISRKKFNEHRKWYTPKKKD